MPEDLDSMKPNDFTMDEDRVFMALYNVWNRSKRSEKLQIEILDTEKKRLEVETKIEEHLRELLKLENKRSDEGIRRITHGTVKIGHMVVVDPTEDPGMMKSYWFKNDGPNNVLFGVNVSPDGVTIEENDIDIDSPGIVTVKSGEIESAENNENVIMNIYIKAISGDSDFRLKLTR